MCAWRLQPLHVGQGGSNYLIRSAGGSIDLTVKSMEERDNGVCRSDTRLFTNACKMKEDSHSLAGPSNWYWCSTKQKQATSLVSDMLMEVAWTGDVYSWIHRFHFTSISTCSFPLFSISCLFYGPLYLIHG